MVYLYFEHLILSRCNYNFYSCSFYSVICLEICFRKNKLLASSTKLEFNDENFPESVSIKESFKVCFIWSSTWLSACASQCWLNLNDARPSVAGKKAENKLRH